MPQWSLSGDPPSATLVFGGDIALHRWQSPGDIPAVFGGLADCTRGADLFVANLETQLTTAADPVGTIGSSIRAGPEAVDVLSFLGLGAVTCANNHCLDFGAAALAESRTRLGSAGITVTGITTEASDGSAVMPVRDLRVGLLAYTDDWRAEGLQAGAPAPNPHDPDRVRQEIRGMRAGAHIVVVQLHWGYEWSMYPLRSMRDLARSYVEAGADIVVCHHAHVPMGVERWRHGIVAHGLGNLYFGRMQRIQHPFRHASILLEVRVSARGVAGALAVPVRTAMDGRVGLDGTAGASRTAQCLAYLSNRLGRDAYLDRVERSLLEQQTATLVADLARRVASGDRNGALERIRYLGPPRQRLLTSNPGVLGANLAPMATFLEQVHAGARDPLSAATRPGLERLGDRARRYLARVRQKGRIP